MNAQDLFNKFGIQYNQLVGELEGNSTEEFVQKWNVMFSQISAKNTSSVIYIWIVDNLVPRFSGESNILYIGKTIQSIAQRELKYSQKEITGFNWKRYQFVFQKYSSIKILFAKVSDPKKMETEFLTAYSDEHLELPPFNRMSS